MIYILQTQTAQPYYCHDFQQDTEHHHVTIEDLRECIKFRRMLNEQRESDRE